MTTSASRAIVARPLIAVTFGAQLAYELFGAFCRQKPLHSKRPAPRFLEPFPQLFGRLHRRRTGAAMDGWMTEDRDDVAVARDLEHLAGLHPGQRLPEVGPQLGHADLRHASIVHSCTDTYRSDPIDPPDRVVRN